MVQRKIEDAVYACVVKANKELKKMYIDGFNYYYVQETHYYSAEANAIVFCIELLNDKGVVVEMYTLMYVIVETIVDYIKNNTTEYIIKKVKLYDKYHDNIYMSEMEE